MREALQCSQHELHRSRKTVVPEAEGLEGDRTDARYACRPSHRELQTHMVAEVANVHPAQDARELRFVQA